MTSSLFDRTDAAAAETARLAALASYRVVDSPPEPAFDRIVRLAALMLEAPIAMISLIDADRQWFKAKYGIDAPETPRAEAFCDHAIRSHELMVVPNAVLDVRFSSLPSVTGAPDIRFYAGAPLVTPEGFSLGTLCAVDRVPRQMDAREAEILTTLAAQVLHELEMRAAMGELYREVAEGRGTARTLQGEGAKLEALLNATGNAVVTADAAGRVASLNRVAEELFGLDAGEALGWPMTSLVETLSKPSGGDFGDAVSEGTGRRKGGNQFPIELSHASWIDANGKTASGAVLRDMTKRRQADIERRKREAAKRTQERLAGLGQMAGGVAHEINNLLQPVIGLTTIELEALSRPCTPEQEETRENLEMVVQCGKQMRAIVRKILMFARKETPELVPLDFPRALQETIAFVTGLLPAGICVDFALEETGCPPALDGPRPTNLALINEVELIEVMTNLAINASHAMDGRGRLSIALHRLTLADAAAANLGVSAGDYFELRVADSGCGMDENTMANIFDPFFTTKAVGEGTGLGLSTAYGVLRDWKGAIEVESALGRGTVFTLYVPIHDSSR